MAETLITKMQKKVVKKCGEGSAIILGQEGVLSRSEVTEVIPTGLSVLDHYVLGCGGWPIGRVVELFGDEGAGKSSLAYSALASVQREGGIGILIDTEQALSEDRMLDVFGVDPEKLLLLQPDHIEGMFAQLEEALSLHDPETDGPVVVVWDSVAATQTEKTFKDGLDAKAGVAELARIMSTKLQAVIQMAPKHRMCFIAVNQVREKIGVMFGDPTTTPGGRALKFYASVRLKMNAGASIKGSKEGQNEGRHVYIKAIKNKLAAPYRTSEVRYYYAKGWDEIWSTLNHAKDQELLDRIVYKNEEEGEKLRQQMLEKLDWLPKPA